MDVEIEFFCKNFAKQNLKLLTDHIQKIASGEAPLPPATLSLVYDKLVERFLVQPAALDSEPAESTKTGSQSVAGPSLTTRTENPTTGINSSCTPSTSSAPSQQTPEPEPVPPGAVWLKCFQCGERARLRDLFDGLRCPRCPSRSPVKGKPFMKCPLCNLVRGERRDIQCIRLACRAPFV